jgi:hypothetical protein
MFEYGFEGWEASRKAPWPVAESLGVFSTRREKRSVRVAPASRRHGPA